MVKRENLVRNSSDSVYFSDGCDWHGQRALHFALASTTYSACILEVKQTKCSRSTPTESWLEGGWIL